VEAQPVVNKAQTVQATQRLEALPALKLEADLLTRTNPTEAQNLDINETCSKMKTGMTSSCRRLASKTKVDNNNNPVLGKWKS
jgi:hypothetical protein